MCEIRRYEDQNHRDVVRLHHLGLDQFEADAGQGPWDDDLEDIRTHYLESRGEFLVVTDQEAIIAMGALRQVSSDIGEVKRMRVHPDFQRQGLGRLVLNALENKATDLAYRKLVLDTTIKQGPAQAFYIKHGYREVRRVLSETPGLIFFEKALGLT